MFRKAIAFFLLSIFIISVTVPTVATLIDDKVDVSYLIDMNEEESKEKEASKDAEPKIIEINRTNISLYGQVLSDKTQYYLKNYARPYLNLLSPPPEHNIL